MLFVLLESCEQDLAVCGNFACLLLLAEIQFLQDEAVGDESSSLFLLFFLLLLGLLFGRQVVGEIEFDCVCFLLLPDG